MADRTVKVTLVAGVNSFITDWERAQKSVDKAASATEAATAKYEKQASAMREIGGAVTAAGAVAVAATALAVKAAIDWETAWAGVTKTVDGSAEEMAELEGSLRSLARELPATHTEIAAVAEAAGQLGVAREDVAKFTETMINLGETTNLSADEAATSIAQLMNIMQTAPEDVERLGATLVALGNNGASTERDIVQMAQRIAGSGALVGATEGEVLGLANALASMGVTAELGGGVASRVLQDLYSAVQEGGEKLKGFADVSGVTSQEFTRQFSEDPVRALDTFAKGLNNVEASGGNVVATLTDLGFRSTEEQRVLLQLKNAGDLLVDSLDMQAVAWEENTALSDEAEKRYATTASQLQVLSNKANDTAITFGSAFLPAIGALTEALGSLLDGFSGLPEGMQQSLSVLGGLAGAATLAGGAFLLAVPKIAEFRIALGVLSSSSIPAVASAAGLAQGAIGRVGTAASGVARFLTGPWGLALAAAAVGVGALQQAMDGLKATAAEYENAIRNASNANDLFAVSDRGTPVSVLSLAIKDADTFKEKLDIIANNPFLKGVDLASQQLDANLGRIGEQLGALATTDLPAAQNGFRVLADTYKLSAQEQAMLLDRMPAFRDALTSQANELGVQVEGLSAAQRATALLKLAQGESEAPAKSAAEAYKEAADKANALAGEVRGLIDSINEANGVGQDAVSTNAAYQAALQGISDEVARQREEYEQTNGTLEGFNLSLDQNTASGSANAAMLADVAGKAQQAAAAQFEQDKATMSAKDATDKYVGTLGSQRQAFIDSATGAGFNADEVSALADQIFRLPSEKEVEVIAETATASQRISSFFNQWNGRRINIGVDVGGGQKYTIAGTGVAFNKDGNFIESYANGGLRERHVAQMARAGAWRVWAEPETGGESYIPHAESKRARSEAILSDTANLFGGAYLTAAQIRSAGIVGFADGGVVPRYASSTSAPRVNVTTPAVQFPSQIMLALEDGTQLRGYVQNAAADVVRNAFSSDQGGGR